MSHNWKTAKIVGMSDINPSIKSLLIKNLDGSPFIFKAGQFVTFDLPISDKKAKRLRSYSIASSPALNNYIELIIVLATPSEGGSAYFFNDVHVGTELTYRGPLGNFCLPEKIENDILFVCTGTGVAPFLSMLYDLLHTQKVNEYHFTLIYGCRKKENIIYQNPLTQLAQHFANFTYIPTLSRSQESWGGEEGYVHHVYKKILSEGGINPHIYLCGWRAMVDEARNHLKQMNVKSNRIHFELYG